MTKEWLKATKKEIESYGYKSFKSKEYEDDLEIRGLVPKYTLHIGESILDQYNYSLVIQGSNEKYDYYVNGNTEWYGPTEEYVSDLKVGIQEAIMRMNKAYAKAKNETPDKSFKRRMSKINHLEDVDNVRSEIARLCEKD